MGNKFIFTGTRRHILLKGHHSNHYTDYGKSSDRVTWADPNELGVIWPTICKIGNVQQQLSKLKWHVRVRLQHEQAAHSFNTHLWYIAPSISIHIYALSEVPYNNVTWAWLCDMWEQARSAWPLHFSPSQGGSARPWWREIIPIRRTLSNIFVYLGHHKMAQGLYLYLPGKWLKT